MSRYEQLTHVIDLIKPKSIVEIGTWCGRNAIAMIKQAQKHKKNIQYIGYDLFEDANDVTDNEELNVKRHFTVKDVQEYISKECPGAFINLIKGNTRDTLKPISADLAYIDGGHSVETIASDYERCKGSSVIVLDDYYTEDEDGKIPDLKLYGCNALVDSSLKSIILPIKTKINMGGYCQMAMTFGGEQ